MTKIDDLYMKAAAALTRGDAAQWEAAETMFELLKLGQSQREIAQRLQRSRNTVRRYLAVMGGSRVSHPRPPFSEALAELDDRDYAKERIPVSPEKRAALAAELLKDKAVADAPAVRRVEERHEERRFTQKMADWNREAGKPTRTEETHDRRRRSVVVNRVFWRDFLYDLQKINREINEAIAELDRTGLPDGPGDIIKAARSVGRAAERFTAAASEHAIGTPLDQT